MPNHALDQAASALAALYAARNCTRCSRAQPPVSKGLTSAFAALIQIPGLKKIYWITKFALRPCLRPVHYWQQPAFLQFTWQAAASSTGIATASNESAPRSSKIFLMEVSFVFQAVQPLPRKLIAVALLSVRVRSSVITRSGEATYRYYPGACEEKLMR